MGIDLLTPRECEVIIRDLGRAQCNDRALFPNLNDNDVKREFVQRERDRENIVAKLSLKARAAQTTNEGSNK